MRKIISGIVLLALSTASFSAMSDSHKTTVCHKGKEISVANSAVPAHKNHGDTVGECDDDGPDTKPPKPETVAAVVMMRCEAQLGDGVLVVSSSSSPDQGIQPREDCAVVLAELLDEKYKIRSISSGSAEDGNGTLRLFTDYLLLGRAPVEEDDDVSIDD